MIHFIEELSLNAWPALQTMQMEGWLLRLAAGYTRRANSVQPLYAAPQDPEATIRTCEQVYAMRGQDTVFKLTPAAQPDALDLLLADMGYCREAPTSVQTRSLADFAPPAATTDVQMAAQVTEDWLDLFCRLNAVAPRHRPTMARMLTAIVPSCCFITLQQAGAPVAVGLAVAERGYVGLFDLVTAPAHRNQGLGRQLVGHLLGWGQAQGAHTAYLQVMYDNAPAWHLYATLGFQEVYSYWYRVKARQ